MPPSRAAAAPPDRVHDATAARTPARWAARPERSRGRLHAEPPPRYRSEFQRDRDRVIHSAAFRRLEYKTQVFVNHEGDMFRTRLTHSIEVAQIARTVARALRLDEDLTEAIALAHDLGHTPFGHAGQDALNACMREFGGFEHNLQSLRVVDVLERRYAAFSGLNLTFESREGILKHCSAANARFLGALGQRFLSGGQPSLEAQTANVADEIAYNNHDVDDGLRAGLIRVEALAGLALFSEHLDAVRAEWPQLDEKRAVSEVVRRMVNAEVVDLVETSGAALESAGPADPDAVRARREPLIGFSAEMAARHLELKRFLREHLYRHERVRHMTARADRIVRDLFAAFMERPDRLPPEWTPEAAPGDGETLARTVADYVAGMTDRFAIAEHARLSAAG